MGKEVGVSILTPVIAVVGVLAVLFLLAKTVWVSRILLVFARNQIHEATQKPGYNQALRTSLLWAGVVFLVAGILWAGALLLFPQTRQGWRIIITGFASLISARLLIFAGQLLWRAISWLRHNA